MKKAFLNIAIVFVAFFVLNQTSFAQIPFPQAIATCEEYSQDGTIEYKGEAFDLTITLNKAKDNRCIYKEKIHQNRSYQMLTCEFTKNQLGFLSDSMTRFNKEFKKQIDKNKIFEAKMTTNGEIFQKYLVNPNYCKITHSKSK
ncbi:hypothetical protein IJX73_05150 [bacterium]|nr:hypothetical protein [bacterium]